MLSKLFDFSFLLLLHNVPQKYIKRVKQINIYKIHRTETGTSKC